MNLRTLVPACRVEPGAWDDYRALERHHYRGGAPATHVRVLRAVVEGLPGMAGVLVVSMPTLNAPWREEAWGARYAPDGRGGKRGAAQRVNAEVRTISRVVVDPAARGLGVARRLVEAYLRAPLTIRTEALASLARYCPFFARAGMREVTFAPAARDRALLGVLDRAGIEPWRLADVGFGARVLAERREIGEALRRWLLASRGTRRHADAWAPAEALALAAGNTQARPVAYVWG